MTRRILAVVAPLVIIAALLIEPQAVCDRGRTPQPSPQGPVNMNLRQVKMKLGTRHFTLEIAETDEQRRIGLMNRLSLPRDHGMLFVFEREEMQSFWMKNTHIPLDIIFLDARGRVVAVKAMKPRDLTTVWSGAPAMYAIEVNRGAAAESQINVGDVMELPAELRAAPRD